MKKFLQSVLWLLLLSACNNTPTDKKYLVNTWRLENLEYEKPIPADRKDMFERSIAEMREQFKLVYNSDGTYESHFGGRVLTGSYEISDDGTRLTARDSSGYTQNYRIISLSENRLKFEATLPSEKVIFVMKPEER